ncbi:DUF362 domain-containing protein [Saccharicrinis aurantiacus]|uniref:DUF362 domain-containing protein n=1 Tax=Saccharicrinis aurantiacus TaxID=1849719 RepID=UPI00094FF2AF|nr:DUF362 domain-containing protein [Saccharicrinis aurantiacus]
MDRRNFLKKGATAAAVSTIAPQIIGGNEANAANTSVEKSGELVAVMGDSPSVMLTKAIEELGGITKFVKVGQKIVIKPNIGWAKEPEMAANTNPEVVGALVKLCKDAGASEVLVFDHTCNEWNSCYEKSGIKEATEANGGKMVPGNNEKYYKEVDLPKGVSIKSTKIHEAIINCDAWINVPVLKHHGGAKMSLSMKNSMGIIWDRKVFHKDGLQQCIADLATYEKKPILNIIDAYRAMTQNGPQGKGVEDTLVTKALFASADPVAVDTAAVKFFGQIKDMRLEDVKHISLAEKHQLGTQDLSSVNVKRVKL